MTIESEKFLAELSDQENLSAESIRECAQHTLNGAGESDQAIKRALIEGMHRELEWVNSLLGETTFNYQELHYAVVKLRKFADAYEVLA